MQVGPAEAPLASQGAQMAEAEGDERADPEGQGEPQSRDELVSLHPGDQGQGRAAQGVAEKGHGHGPEHRGDEVDDEEGGRPHPERPAGCGDRHAQAVGEAAQEQEEEAAARDHVQEPAEVLVGREAALEPVAAAPLREAEVGEVGEGVGGHGHRHDPGQREDAAPGQEGGEEHDHLALDEHAAEEERVSVLDEELFHGFFRSEGRRAPAREESRSPAPGEG